MELQFFRHLKHYRFVIEYGNKTLSLLCNHFIFKGRDNVALDILLRKEYGINIYNYFTDKNKFSYHLEKAEIENLSKSLIDLEVSVMIEIIRLLWKENKIKDPGGEMKNRMDEILSEINFVCEKKTQNNNIYRSNNYDRINDDDNSEFKAYNIDIKERIDKITNFKESLNRILIYTKILIPEKVSVIDKLITQMEISYENILKELNKHRKPIEAGNLYNEYELDGWEKTQLRTAIINHLNTYTNWTQFNRYLYYYLQKELEDNFYKKWKKQCENLVDFSFYKIIPFGFEFDETYHGRGLKKFNTEDTKRYGIESIRYPSGNEEEPRIVIVSGNAGAGKSIFSSVIFLKFYKAKFQPIESNYDNIYKNYKFSFYINFRNIQEMGMKHFDDYLNNLFPKTLDIFNFNQIKDVLSEAKCLVLCDEYNAEHPNDRSFFETLIEFQSKNNINNDNNNNDNNKWKIVITTQPGGSKQLTTITRQKILPNALVKLNILDLDIKDMHRLLNNIISKNNDIFYNDEYYEDKIHSMDIKLKEFINVIQDQPAIKDMLKNPLYFNHLVFQYINDDARIKELLCDYLSAILDINNDNESDDDDDEDNDNIPYYKYMDYHYYDTYHYNEYYYSKNERVRKFAIHLYVQQELYKMNRIFEKTKISKELLKKFDSYYLNYSLNNFQQEKKLELSEEEIFQSIKQHFKFNDINIDQIHNFGDIHLENFKFKFDTVLSYYFNVKYKKINGVIKKVYCYKYDKELEFAAARKICANIVEETERYKRKKLYKKGIIMKNVLDVVLESNGILRKLNELEELASSSSLTSTSVRNRIYELIFEENVIDFMSYTYLILFYIMDTKEAGYFIDIMKNRCISIVNKLRLHNFIVYPTLISKRKKRNINQIEDNSDKDDDDNNIISLVDYEDSDEEDSFFESNPPKRKKNA